MDLSVTCKPNTSDTPLDFRVKSEIVDLPTFSASPSTNGRVRHRRKAAFVRRIPNSTTCQVKSQQIKEDIKDFLVNEEQQQVPAKVTPTDATAVSFLSEQRLAEAQALFASYIPLLKSTLNRGAVIPKVTQPDQEIGVNPREADNSMMLSFGKSIIYKSPSNIASSSASPLLDPKNKRALDIAYKFRTGAVRLWMVAGDTLQLWQFLFQLLLDTTFYDDDDSAPIKWMGDYWDFKIANSECVARLWGLYKNCPRMNYAKLARGLRFYYGKAIVEKTPIAFVYRFYDDKVGRQSIDGTRLRECIEAAPQVVRDTALIRALSHVDRRLTMSELLALCYGAVSEDDRRPTKMFQYLSRLLSPPPGD